MIEQEKISVETEHELKEVDRLLELQRQSKQRLRMENAGQRIEKIKRLRDVVLEHKEEIRKALYADFKKAAVEVDMTETFVVVNEANHAIRKLKRWLRPKRVATPLNLIGTSGYIYPEARGNCLIIAPWNYPVNLLLGPLVSAIAGGNAVLLKPSEYTPATGALVEKIVKQTFKEDEVAVVHGGAEFTAELLKRRFDHIFFTGSPRVGKLVMKAAADHLTSLTLELGGKSPSIIDESADLKFAAKKIITGKFFNGGQTCIGHDYLFVHKSKQEALLKALKEQIDKNYGEDKENSVSLARIINHKNYLRLKELMDEVVQLDPQSLKYGGKHNEADNFIEPSIFLDPPQQSKMMQEEIFGPLLPILSYENIEDVINYINDNEKPLALYVFTKRASFAKKMIRETSSGSVNINETATHYYHLNLPFGGINNSGLGSAHGYSGFKAFTHMKGVMKQHFKYSPIELVFPPFTKKSEKWADIFLRFFSGK